ncbi:MAG: hypothetical protein ABFS09_10640 [Thermodesulfobacteriota bacterium]
MLQDESLWLRIAPIPAASNDFHDLQGRVAPGQRGRVTVHRFDPTFLIVNLPERDTAEARSIGDGEAGLADTTPLEFAVPQDRQGGD